MNWCQEVSIPIHPRKGEYGREARLAGDVDSNGVLTQFHQVSYGSHDQEADTDSLGDFHELTTVGYRRI
jgi:hypothetical protein